MKPDLLIRDGRLRPAVTDDLEALVRLLHDEGVRRYLCDDVLLPKATVAEMLERSERLDQQGLGLWVIEHGHDGFAGIAGLEPVLAEAGTAPQMTGGIEPIIAVSPDCWGRGLAGQALGALIDYARDALGSSKLVAAGDEPNARSHRLMLGCGFLVIGRAAGLAHELTLYQRLLKDSEPMA